jgi:hypothetical protein
MLARLKEIGNKLTPRQRRIDEAKAGLAAMLPEHVVRGPHFQYLHGPSPILVVRFPLSSTGMNYQNRSVGSRQLDDGIGDTLEASEMITSSAR